MRFAKGKRISVCPVFFPRARRVRTAHSGERTVSHTQRACNGPAPQCSAAVLSAYALRSDFHPARRDRWLVRPKSACRTASKVRPRRTVCLGSAGRPFIHQHDHWRPATVLRSAVDDRSPKRLKSVRVNTVRPMSTSSLHAVMAAIHPHSPLTMRKRVQFIHSAAFRHHFSARS